MRNIVGVPDYKKIHRRLPTEKMKINEGKVSLYYVENNHPAIIDLEEWDLVQT